MTEALLRFALITAVIFVAAGLGFVARRRLSYHPPVDVGAMSFDPGLVVFTSTACRRCKEVLVAARATGAPLNEISYERDAELQQEAGVVGVPLTLVIDRSGNVTHQFAGLVSRRRLQRALRQSQLIG